MVRITAGSMPEVHKSITERGAGLLVPAETDEVNLSCRAEFLHNHGLRHNRVQLTYVQCSHHRTGVHFA